MRHHLLIGGTGRAGTTFLVKYLSACGLDTHLTKNPGSLLDEPARAGLEDVALSNPDSPYVVKSPWLYEWVGRVLADTTVVVDAVLIPMRGIVEAATSRTLNELRARYADEALPDEMNLWETWGKTPGGVVYSLNPVDQARLLAMGFHELIQALVKKDIPVVLLDFPRFVEDADYLYRKLRPVLGAKLDHAKALGAHRELADPSMVRVGKELAADTVVAQGRVPASASNVHASALEFPSYGALDRVALRRELDKNRKLVVQSGQQIADAASRAAADAQLIARLTDEVAAGRSRAAGLEQLLGEAGDRAGELENTIAIMRGHIAQMESKLTVCKSVDGAKAKVLARLELALAHEVARAEARRRDLEEMSAVMASEQQLMDALHLRVVGLEQSRSWRVSAPIRAVSGWLKSGKNVTDGR